MILKVLVALLLFYLWLPGSSVHAQAIVLERVTTIGSEADAHQVFGAGLTAAVGTDGTIYVGEPSSSEIRVFTPEGEFQYTLGSRGHGPGEFMRLRRLALHEDKNHLIVMDSQLSRFTLFDIASRKHVMTQTFDMTLNPIHGLFLTDDGIVITGSRRDTRQLIHIFDYDGAYVRSVAGLLDELELPQFPWPVIAQLSMSSAVSLGDETIVVLAAPYVMARLDSKGNTLWKIHDDIVPEPWRQHIRVSAATYEVEHYPQAYYSFGVGRDAFMAAIHHPDQERSFIDLRSTLDGSLLHRLDLQPNMVVLAATKVDDGRGWLVLLDNATYYVDLWRWHIM